MVKAEYNYALKKIINTQLILIQDKNQGSMSVTNDIENVISEICKNRKIDCKEAIVLYKDTEDVWDGFDCKTNQFIPLNGETWQEALEKYDIQHQVRNRQEASH